MLSYTIIHDVEQSFWLYIAHFTATFKCVFRTKSLSGMYNRKAVPAYKLPEIKKVNRSTEDVTRAEKRNVETRPNSEPLASATAADPSSDKKHVIDRTSKVLAMSQMFENKSKETLGLKTYKPAVPVEKKDVQSNISGDSTNVSVGIASISAFEKQNDAEPTTKTDSGNKGSLQNLSTTKEIKNSNNQAQDSTLDQSPENINRSEAKVGLPGSNVHLTDSKQKINSFVVHSQVQDSKSDQSGENKTHHHSKIDPPGSHESLVDSKQNITSCEAISEKASVNASNAVPTLEGDKTEIFPSLLESLVDVQKRDMKRKPLTSSSSNDTLPTSAFVPLISELPKVPETKSRSDCNLF